MCHQQTWASKIYTSMFLKTLKKHRNLYRATRTAGNYDGLLMKLKSFWSSSYSKIIQLIRKIACMLWLKTSLQNLALASYLLIIIICVYLCLPNRYQEGRGHVLSVHDCLPCLEFSRTCRNSCSEVIPSPPLSPYLQIHFYPYSLL